MIHTAKNFGRLSFLTAKWTNKWLKMFELVTDSWSDLGVRNCDRILRDYKMMCASRGRKFDTNHLSVRVLLMSQDMEKIRPHRVGTQIRTEEYFLSQRGGKQTWHRKYSADVVRTQHRCTEHALRLTETLEEEQMNQQTDRKKNINKQCTYKHDYRKHMCMLFFVSFIFCAREQSMLLFSPGSVI